LWIGDLRGIECGPHFGGAIPQRARQVELVRKSRPLRDGPDTLFGWFGQAVTNIALLCPEHATPLPGVTAPLEKLDGVKVREQVGRVPVAHFGNRHASLSHGIPHARSVIPKQPGQPVWGEASPHASPQIGGGFPALTVDAVAENALARMENLSAPPGVTERKSPARPVCGCAEKQNPEDRPHSHHILQSTRKDLRP
jgi:hypothetical protein